LRCPGLGRFEEPIELPDGRKLKTLAEAMAWLAKEIRGCVNRAQGVKPLSIPPTPLYRSIRSVKKQKAGVRAPALQAHRDGSPWGASGAQPPQRPSPVYGCGHPATPDETILGRLEIVPKQTLPSLPIDQE
jgi:hypothetical protein